MVGKRGGTPESDRLRNASSVYRMVWAILEAHRQPPYAMDGVGIHQREALARALVIGVEDMLRDAAEETAKGGL